MRHEPLKDRAVGRWKGILPSLGIPSKALTNRHGPCPMCGGKDRFRFDDKGGRGTWFCSHCGAGDGIELVKRFQNCEFKDAARLIEQHYPRRSDPQRRQEAGTDRCAEAAGDDRPVEAGAADHAGGPCRALAACPHGVVRISAMPALFARRAIQ